MPGKQRAILLLLAVAAAIVAIIVVPSLGDDEDSGDGTDVVQTQPTTSTATTPSAKKPARRRDDARGIALRNGKSVGGVKRLSYKKGETVDVVFTSNTADEVHVHGYDLEKALPAGGRARLRFRAKLEGIYEIELHGSGQQIAQLRVNP